MRYFLVDPDGTLVGPYAREELALLRERGLLGDDTRVVLEGEERVRAVGEALGLPPVPPLLEGRRRDGPAPAPEEGAGAARDFLRLAPHLMLPLADLRNLRWLDNRRILGLAVVGLMPLFLLFYLQRTADLSGSMWGVALYSSLLWALFFYVAFSQPDVRVGRCLMTFAGSALFSIGLVALARFLVPIPWVLAWINAPSLAHRWLGHLVGVALIEELAKLFMLYFLWSYRPRPQVMMFYGLMAGLGFGIYEGVAYQSSYNLRVSFGGGIEPQLRPGVYYLLNILRLTSLPFLHALWTGIAGYFIGFAGQYRERQGGLLLAAVLVPSLLHGTYNTFSDSALGLCVALFTVVALNVYLLKGQDFERVLAGSRDP